MPRGRPKLHDAKMVHVSLRVPKDLLDWYKTQPSMAEAMRDALQQHREGADT